MQKKLMATFLTLTTLLSLGSPAAQAQANTLKIAQGCLSLILMGSAVSHFSTVDERSDYIFERYNLTHSQAQEIINNPNGRSEQELEAAQDAATFYKLVDTQNWTSLVQVAAAVGISTHLVCSCKKPNP